MRMMTLLFIFFNLLPRPCYCSFLQINTNNIITIYNTLIESKLESYSIFLFLSERHRNHLLCGRKTKLSVLSVCPSEQLGKTSPFAWKPRHLSQKDLMLNCILKFLLNCQRSFFWRSPQRFFDKGVHFIVEINGFVFGNFLNNTVLRTPLRTNNGT